MIDLQLKELRAKLTKLKMATEKPYEYNPDRYWQSESVQWSNYQNLLDKLNETKEAFFAHLQEKKQAKKLLAV